MQVEVVFGDAKKQILLTLEVPENTTVQQAIEKTNILQDYPELNLADLVVGIFSKKCQLDTILEAGDRVEIYRPLMIDPKEARRLRAQKKTR